MNKKVYFLSTKEIINKSKEYKEVIVWGCGPTAEPVIQTLIDLEIEIAFYGDSNTSLKKKMKDCKCILNPDDMTEHLNSLIIIASFGYVPISKMLYSIGCRNVCALRDVHKYAYSKMLIDNGKLFSDLKLLSDEKTGRVLVELYGNIGDVILRVAVVKRLLNQYGKDNVFLLFASRANADIFKLITENIIIFEESDLSNDDIRFNKLLYINEKNFDKSFVLCDVRIYAQRRILNSLNCNIKEIIYTDILPDKEYLPLLDGENIRKFLNWEYGIKLTGWNELSNDELNYINLPEIISEKYVTVNLGASRKLRHFDPEKFIPICRNLIQKGYEIAFVGYGIEDENIVSSILKNNELKEYIHSYVSQLSLLQSAKIIANSEFYIGTDSGMCHVAYIFGVPSVVIYGGGEYGCFMHPDGMVEYVTVKDDTCFGCKWYCDKIDEYGRAACIYNIGSEQIIKAIEKIEERIYR